MKNLPKPKSIRDIQVFLGFANFYHCFIQDFSKIVTLLTSMLRMSPTSNTQKSMNLVDKFDKGDHGENEAKKASASTKGPIKADYPSFNHVSHTVSNIVSNSAKNVSNYRAQTLKGLLTNYVKLLLKRLSFNTLIQNNTSAFKLMCQGILLVECWVRGLMTWADGIW